jgi:hypothetical protein
LGHRWTNYGLAHWEAGEGRWVWSDREHRNGVAGAVIGGFIARVASAPNHGGLVYTSFAAILGAAIVTGINVYASVRKRYA